MIKARDEEEIEKAKSQLSAEFEMKDLGEAKKILGMEIVRDIKCNTRSSSTRVSGVRYLLCIIDYKFRI